MFTRQHYKAIAEIIKTEYTAFDNTGEDDTEGKHATNSIAGHLAYYFGQKNPRFDRQKFLDACGIPK